MRLSIVPGNNSVTIDGASELMNLAIYPALEGVHAVQWYGSKGHLEFDNSGFPDVEFKPNEAITDISPYQDIIDAWYASATLKPDFDAGNVMIDILTK